MSLKRIAAIPFQLISRHFLSISMITALYIGWLQRSDNYLSAETGPGYLLGIVGGSLMLVLLLYPLSKRVKLLTRWIPVRYWFGIHMMLGVIGPLLVLFHSNFQLGSTNSSIALVSMLLVAGSGLIGRYIYTHIHHGLYGARITLKELNQETENNHRELLGMYEMDETLNQRLAAMEEKSLQPYTGFITSLQHVMSIAINAHQLTGQVKNLINNNANEGTTADRKVVLRSVNRYTLALRRAVAFKLYERLFSLWHVLHLPLFFMMIITTIIHILAVHMY